MMGGTALLEELLAEQAAREPQEPDPERPSFADLELAPFSPGDRSARLETISRRSCDLGVPSEINPLPLPISVDPQYQAVDLDTSVSPPSPLSRQIEELAKEMEDCLGSMENWEEEKLQHRNRLLQELEAQYGFAGGNADFPLDEAQYEFRGDVDCRVDEVDDRGSREVTCHGPFALRHLREEVSSVEALARLRETEEAEKYMDEERIMQLRAEVEDLRLKAEGPRFVDRAGGTPHPGLVLDASLSGLDSTLGLQSWREEVDAVLGGPSFEDELRYGISEPDSPIGLARIEGRLAGARQHARLLEEGVESLHAYAEDELGQLDQLLSECEELHAHLQSRCPEEQMPLGNSLAY